jgi:membrane protease subunit HflC
MSQSLETNQQERVGAVRSLVFRVVLSGLITGVLLAYGCSFTVSEGNNAIVTRFGRPVREIREAGFYWRYPWPIEQFHLIDARLRYFNSPFTATFTRDRKNVVLMTYVVWRVADPLLFFQSLGTFEAAEQKLDGMIAAGKNFHMGNYDLTALVSTDRSMIEAEKIEAAILESVKGPAQEKFGIAIEQVGIKRIAYPQENMAAVLEQMRAERRAEAGELRAKGKKESQKIRDDGLVKAEQILRTGREEAGKILGKAEKEAAEIYAQAHQLDPDFYRFWRSMQVIKKVLGSKATVILRNDQEPFNELFQPPRSVGSEAAAVSKDSGGVSLPPSAERR